MSEDTKVSSRILNTEKNDYAVASLFMGEPLGLMDSINVHYRQLYDLYKEMKSKDWDELEFRFATSTLNAEFKSDDKASRDIMMYTLTWQWEGDTAAARSIVPIIAPFVTNNELFYGWQRIADNEVVHALTYSEIVKYSFDDPDEALKEVLELKQAVSRVAIISEIFDKALVTGCKLNLGQIQKSQETYDDIFMFIVAIYCLEAIQFMSSFGITFSYGNANKYLAAVLAVQKIALDEHKIHQKWDRAVLDIELGTEHGLMAFSRNRNRILELIGAIVRSEMTWNSFTFSGGRSIPGVTEETMNKVVLYYAKGVYEFFRFNPKEIEFELPTRHPLPFMEDWLDIGKTQTSPQEQKNGNYVLGMIDRDVDPTEKFVYDLG